MKKFVCFVFIVSVLTFCSLNNNFASELFAFSENGEVSFYTTSKQNFFDEMTFIKNGESFIYLTELHNAKNTFKKIKNCYGFSICFENSNNLKNKILNKIKIMKIQKIDGIKNYYGFISGLAFSTNIDNKKVNLQIAITDKNIIVGCPIILGSY